MSTYDPKRTWRVRCEMSGRWPVRIPYLDRYGFHDTNDTKQKCHDIRPIQHTIRYLRNILRKVSAHEQTNDIVRNRKVHRRLRLWSRTDQPTLCNVSQREVYWAGQIRHFIGSQRRPSRSLPRHWRMGDTGSRVNRRQPCFLFDR